MNVLGIANDCGLLDMLPIKLVGKMVQESLELFAAEIRKQSLLEASEIDIGCDCCSTQESLELLTEYRGILIAMANKAVK